MWLTSDLEQYSDTPPPLPFLQMQLLPSARTFKGIQKDRDSGCIKCQGFLLMLEFTPTTHAPCLYQGTFETEYVLFLRHVDDFSVACRYESTHISLCDNIYKHWKVPMKLYGMMKHSNGIDVS
jgi:hypothetical protein